MDMIKPTSGKRGLERWDGNKTGTAHITIPERIAPSIIKRAFLWFIPHSPEGFEFPL